jgi:hypothetical protein
MDFNLRVLSSGKFGRAFLDPALIDGALAITACLEDAVMVAHDPLAKLRKTRLIAPPTLG